jgi:hypothetical protein
VEVALAPLGVARRRLRVQARGERARVHRVDVVHVEDETAPPGPAPLRRLGDEIEVLATTDPQ